ncbi:MAG: PhoH family protein [Chthoniobacterales bacterium]|nr:PhoH family protein [Chthoniobacterales bacterium]MCX7713847.1 PhoH family protein [Chthoniobacterales bacterium]
MDNENPQNLPRTSNENPNPQHPPQKNTTKGKVKNYVLDTNVLLHDPHCLHRFENNHVIIPVEVLSELDKFKNEPSERGANARAAHRFLLSFFAGNTRGITRGVQTPGGGTLRIYINPHPLNSSNPSPSIRRFLQTFPDLDRMDHRILAACLALKDSSHFPTILVSKDLNIQLKALAVGILSQDYLSDKVSTKDAEGDAMRTLEITTHDFQRFSSSREIYLPEPIASQLELNEYILLSCSPEKSLPARHRGNGKLERLQIPQSLNIPGGIEIHPLNPGQQCFLDALLDPEISLVTCYGRAGTGKTLLAVAAGLYLTARKLFSGLTVSRPVVSMGDSLGFLPGTLEEKMQPWLQSIYDALEILLPSNPPTQQPKKNKQKTPTESTQTLNGKPLKPYERWQQLGLLEIEALCYIRGRSIPNRFFILDEAQQLTPLEAKTVVTRMSRGSKLIMVGDPAQIDNPYVDSRSNGLVYTRNRLRGHSLTAHITLSKGERSPLAELGASLM